MDFIDDHYGLQDHLQLQTGLPHKQTSDSHTSYTHCNANKERENSLVEYVDETTIMDSSYQEEINSRKVDQIDTDTGPKVFHKNIELSRDDQCYSVVSSFNVVADRSKFTEYYKDFQRLRICCNMTKSCLLMLQTQKH